MKFTMKKTSSEEFNKIKGGWSMKILNTILLCCLFISGCVSGSGSSIMQSFNSIFDGFQTSLNSKTSEEYHGILTIKNNKGLEEYSFISFSGHNIYLGNSENHKLLNNINEVKNFAHKMDSNTYQATVSGCFNKKDNRLILDLNKGFSVYEDTVFPIGGPDKLGQKKICGKLNISHSNGITYYQISNARPMINGNDEVWIADSSEEDIINIINSKNINNGSNICVSGELLYLDISDDEEDGVSLYFATGKDMIITAN